MDLVKITDLTKQLDISSRSLRFYEQIGLIQSVRPNNEKYRYYDTVNIMRLKQIIILRKMQIPVKDIIRIYESQDMRVVVETFVNRMRMIDNEIDALAELKHIIQEFLQEMLDNGITHISALPLLYEEMCKHLEIIDKCEIEQKSPTYEQLADISGRTAKPPVIRLLFLPAMHVMSSQLKVGGVSDVDAFWDYINMNSIAVSLPENHTRFEYQDASGQTVILQKVGTDFINTGPFAEFEFSGGLFAVASVYTDEDIGTFCRVLIQSFDDNPYYEVDYIKGGLREDILIESVISPDSKRELLDIFLPVKKRLPNTELYEPFERIKDATAVEIEAANPVWWTAEVQLDKLNPIYNPYYHFNEKSEAEYVAVISTRMLGTGVEVKLPFRVDIEFLCLDTVGVRFAYGADEGSIRIYHGLTFAEGNPERPITGSMYAFNMGNTADPRLSQEALTFNQPVLGGSFSYPNLGHFEPNVYHTLSWIVGEKHFACILDGEVRFCGVNFPYMTMDSREFEPMQIIIGSNGQSKWYFRQIQVSQLKSSHKVKIKKGDITMQYKQNNNILPRIHPLITNHFGENYWFNGAARYIMECLGETDLADYRLFSGITGDDFAQIYPYDYFRGDSSSDYRWSIGNFSFVEEIFEKVGYVATYVSKIQLNKNREMYRQLLMAYIDKGVPVLHCPWPWGCYVGYEDNGNTLLYISGESAEPIRKTLDQALALQQEDGDPNWGWLFVGEKMRSVNLRQLYRDAITNIPELLTTKNANYAFGAEAFRAWADDIERGKYDDIIAPIPESEFIPAFPVGVWPLPEGTYDPALDGVGLPDGVSIFGLFNESYEKTLPPESIEELTSVETLAALDENTWCVVGASSGFGYVIVNSSKPVTVMAKSKPKDINLWTLYTSYVCNLATNSGGCFTFLEKAQELNPEFTFLEEVRRQYRETGYLWNGHDDKNIISHHIDDNLEALGGGFNVTLEALQDKEKCSRITATLHKFAACIDEVVRIIQTGLDDLKY